MDQDIKGQVFYLAPTEVKLKEGLPRYRQDLGKVKDLIESIREFGQIQPIVINRQNELIAGGRRLAACLMGNIQVMVVYSDVLDPVTMREMEAEENIQRKAFTPAEEVKAMADLHAIKQAKYGQGTPGSGKGWSVEKTAELSQKSKAAVIDDLKLARAIEQFPELTKCKTKSDIRKAVTGIEKTITRAENVKEYTKVLTEQNYPIEIHNIPAEDFLPTLPDNHFDLLLTDPPYGIDIFQNISAKITDNLNLSGFSYNDETDQALILYQLLAKESFRFCKDTAHAMVFLAPEHFWRIREYFQAAGWSVWYRPMLWIKQSEVRKQCNAPYHWPACGSEYILYARRINSRLAMPGQLDWLMSEPIKESRRLHPSHKPRKLLRELIARTSFPNQRMVDPFCGSGESICAGLDEKLHVVASDKLPDAYNAAMENLSRYRAEALKENFGGSTKFNQAINQGKIKSAEAMAEEQRSKIDRSGGAE